MPNSGRVFKERSRQTSHREDKRGEAGSNAGGIDKRKREREREIHSERPNEEKECNDTV